MDGNFKHKNLFEPRCSRGAKDDKEFLFFISVLSLYRDSYHCYLVEFYNVMAVVVVAVVVLGGGDVNRLTRWSSLFSCRVCRIELFD